MMHPDTAVKHVSDTIGDGVFATAFIPLGTIVYVEDALEIKLSPRKFSSLGEKIRRIADEYSFIDNRGYRILSWDIAKFVNHCCEPNSISTGWGFEVALRDIEAGEQITDEYGLFNLEWQIACGCGSPRCRGIISSGDLDRYYSIWDEWIKKALAHLPCVSQPLRDLVERDKLTGLNEYLATGVGYRSVVELKFDRALISSGSTGERPDEIAEPLPVATYGHRNGRV